MKHYNIFLNNECIGMNLSKGELNQWLIDLYNELKPLEQLKFIECFENDLLKNKTLDEIIYNDKAIYPSKVAFKNTFLIIEIIKY